MFKIYIAAFPLDFGFYTKKVAIALLMTLVERDGKQRESRK
jgi:hypothetical protein